MLEGTQDRTRSDGDKGTVLDPQEARTTTVPSADAKEPPLPNKEQTVMREETVLPSLACGRSAPDVNTGPPGFQEELSECLRGLGVFSQ